MWIATFLDGECSFIMDSEMEEIRADMIKDVIKDRQEHPELTKKCQFTPEQAVDEILSRCYKKIDN